MLKSEIAALKHLMAKHVAACTDEYQLVERTPQIVALAKAIDMLSNTDLALEKNQLKVSGRQYMTLGDRMSDEVEIVVETNGKVNAAELIKELRKQLRK